MPDHVGMLAETTPFDDGAQALARRFGHDLLVVPVELVGPHSDARHEVARDDIELDAPEPRLAHCPVQGATPACSDPSTPTTIRRGSELGCTMSPVFRPPPPAEVGSRAGGLPASPTLRTAPPGPPTGSFERHRSAEALPQAGGRPPSAPGTEVPVQSHRGGGRRRGAAARATRGLVLRGPRLTAPRPPVTRSV